MDEETKNKIKNIVNLVKERKALLKELEGLDDYKNKIEKVKQHYARKTTVPKSRRGATTSRTNRRTTTKRRKAK